VSRAARRAFAAAALSALCAPALPGLWPLESNALWPRGAAWGPAALVGAVLLGALPALLSALWIAEVAPRPLARAARLVYDAAAAVPSVAWAALLADAVLPRFGPTPAAALCLAALVAPTTALAALDALGRTPVDLREASLALGATPWQVAWRAVVPAARRELAAAAFLGVGRALAESLALSLLRARPAVGYATLLGAAAVALALHRLYAREDAR
jgi:ABC-type phosphate transport system permease subunit